MTDLRGEEEDVDVFEREAVPETSEAAQRWISLPPAGMLTIEDADALLRWRDASVVAVVGERNGGKTTLVTELYERFLRAPFAGCMFSHSLSLLGFEMKSFESRAESGGTVPDTPRTSKQDGLLFFHLAVGGVANGWRTDLLVSERAGEAYREVRDAPAAALDLIEVRRARTVAFVVDGERLADGRRRAEALSSVRTMARALVDADAIPADASVQLVTTKCDLLRGDGAAAALGALSAMEQRFVEAYQQRFAGVSVHRTAARDPAALGEQPEGLAALLRSWIAPRERHVLAGRRTPALIDEFDHMLVRRMG